MLAEGKQHIQVDGRKCIIETPLHADIALIHAHQADPFGNLRYNASARNFNPLMATAANKVIVETEQLVELGGIEPGSAHTPGTFVDGIVALADLTEAYEVIRR